MSKYQLFVNGTAVGDDVYDAIASLEIEENAELADALRLKLPVNVVSKDLTWIGDSRLAPFANLAVVATPASGNPSQCIFDGYVLAHKIHLESGITASTVEVTAQDASVLMGLQEVSQEWSGQTDGGVANAIFGKYGFTPADGNLTNDTPAHTDDGHTLMQRGSDIDFLRRLARRTGRWCRVTCNGTPASYTGYFAVPALDASPTITLDLNDTEKHTVKVLEFDWDVSRPTGVSAQQASLTDSDSVDASTSSSGLKPLSTQALANFAGRPTTVILTATADSDELPGRAAGMLQEAGWFVRVQGTTDVDSVAQVLRVGQIVAIQNIGQLLSGNYLVESVRHTITATNHVMAFVLVSNAIGAAAGGGSGLPGL
jgi:phage protein D